MPKPRMVKSDSWKKRPIVLKYWAYKDSLQPYRDKINWEGLTIQFMIETPKSWSKKKKEGMIFTPHKQTPDIDNMLKGFMDCLMDEDSSVWHIKHAAKLWGANSCIIVNFKPCDPIELAKKLAKSSVTNLNQRQK